MDLFLVFIIALLSNLMKYDSILTSSDRRGIYVSNVFAVHRFVFFFADILDMKIGRGFTMKL